LGWEQVDRVLLVGGSTHMPMTGAMLRELSGRPPDNSLAVSEVVARGAAIHAGILEARGQTGSPSAAANVLADVVEISVNAHSLGIEVRKDADRANDVLIPKNTQLPAASSRVYYTMADNQSRVRVRVLQGEAAQADACIPVGECWIDGLPPGLPRGSPVQVRCAVAANGLIDVMALDMTSGRMARAEIHRSSGLSDDEVAREAAWVKGLRIQ
jgi:molecular chaperone DnaK